MTEQQDTLLALAEVAVALAGFSAIVVVLKRRESGRWGAGDADRFHGMVIHSICAVVFCLLPSVIDVIVQDPVSTLHITAGVLGAQIIGHCLMVMALATSGGAFARAMLSLGLLVGCLMFAVFSDWGAHREFAIYTVGIIWHILQAGVLFVMLVWIPSDSVEDA